MLLYRYFASHALESLRDSRLKASRITSFNDPFESRFGCGGEMNRSKAKTIDRTAHTRIAANMKKMNPLLSRKEIRQNLRDDRSNRISRFISGYDATEEDSLKEMGRILDLTFRAICFSASDVKAGDEILMWSHYCAHHGGVRIGFEFPKSPSFSVTELDYAHQRVSVDMSIISIDPDSQKEAITRFLRTKNQAWKYEKEFRLFIEPQSCLSEKHADGKTIEFVQIRSDWVRRVDFGVRHSQSKRDSYLALLRKNYPWAECYQAHYHKTDYALVYEKLI